MSHFFAKVFSKDCPVCGGFANRMFLDFAGQTFKAHRLVLAACSTHFANLFSHAPVNAPTHSQLFVILDGTRADDLQVLLQFMYRGEAYLHQDRINSVLRTAEVLQIKGLTQVPNEINEQNLSGGASIVGTPSASNARRWSPPHESPPHRATVGIMGHMSRSHHIRKEPREPPPRDLHRDLVDASPPPGPSSHHLLPGSSSHHSSAGHHAGRSPEHPFAYPTSRAGENFSVYGTGSRFSLPNFSRSNNRDYSPTSQVRDRSPPERGRSYGSASAGTPTLIPKEEREDFYDHRSGNGGSRSGSLSHHDRNTPASDKASERHTPASHHGDRDRDYERGSSRNSPPSPVVTPSSLGKSTPNPAPSFPSDSTSDYAKAASSSNFKERIRRSSESAAAVTTAGGLPPGGEEGNEAAERSKFHEFRREADQTLRVRSPSGGRSGNKKIAYFLYLSRLLKLMVFWVIETRLSNNEEDAQAANQLEAFRRIAQAQAERERFLPRGVGALHGGISGVAQIAAQGLTGSASDYMRLAMPVRESDNGDAISGSGKI